VVLTQYRSHEDGWSLAWSRAFTAETAAAHHLPSDAFIGAFAMSPDDYPLVAVPNHGIYAFVDGSLGRVLHGKFEGYLPKDGVHYQWVLREFLALRGDRFVATLTSGELIEILPGGDLRRIELPSAGPAPNR